MADSQTDRNGIDYSAAPILGPPVPFRLVSNWLGFAMLSVAGIFGAIYLFPPNEIDAPEVRTETVAKLTQTSRIPTPRPFRIEPEAPRENTILSEGANNNIAVAKETEDTKFAIFLGTTAALPSLRRRYQNISRLNAHLLGNLQARAQFSVSDGGPVVRLLIGPLDTGQQARNLCEFMQLPQNISCQPSEFVGEPLN